jgi:hypothetical protein
MISRRKRRDTGESNYEHKDENKEEQKRDPIESPRNEVVSDTDTIEKPGRISRATMSTSELEKSMQQSKGGAWLRNVLFSHRTEH